MSKMKKLMKVSNPLNNTGGTGESMDAFDHPDADVYGGLDLRVTSNVVARPISLYDIQPDPTQPRRVLPSYLRHLLRSASIDEIIMQWHIVAEQELGERIDTLALIEKRGQVAEEESNASGAAGDFLEMLKLAGDIHRDGLLNPITIIGLDTPYRIETGERRWWAYHMLRFYIGSTQWEAIPANITHRASVWRMAGENQSRQNLNSIAKARQLALIIMDLNVDRDYLPYDSFPHDREYYAQVGNGNEHRIPDDRLKEVCDATGLSSKAQVSQYRRLVRDLDNDLWDKFDQDNTPELVIRQILSTPLSKRLTTVNLTPPAPPPVSGKLGKFWHETTVYMSKQRKLADRVGGDERAEMVRGLRILADEIEKIGSDGSKKRR